MSIVNATKSNFKEEVISSKTPVLIDFYADWCGPCRMISPIISQIAEENSDIRVAKVNVDTEVSLAQEFGVTSIPTLVVMNGGEVVNKTMGYKDKNDILELLKVSK